MAQAETSLLEMFNGCLPLLLAQTYLSQIGEQIERDFFIRKLRFQVEKRSYRECAGEKSPCIPTECVGLRETYFNCKRGQKRSKTGKESLAKAKVKPISTTCTKSHARVHEELVINEIKVVMSIKDTQLKNPLVKW